MDKKIYNAVMLAVDVHRVLRDYDCYGYDNCFAGAVAEGIADTVEALADNDSLVDDILERLQEIANDDAGKTSKEAMELTERVQIFRQNIKDNKEDEQMYYTKDIEGLKKYTMDLLDRYECDEYTYGDTPADTIIKDLKECDEDIKYPVVDVANMIIEISKRKPIKRAPWIVAWDTDNCCDGYGCETFEQAKDGALDILVTWAVEEHTSWKSDTPTQEEAENWNHMIYNCEAWVQKYDPDDDEYHDYWYPSDEELEEIGWKEIEEV